MRRRDLIAATAGLPVLATAVSAHASSDKKEEGGGTVQIPGVGLPILSDGRVMNYVFVALQLQLGPHAQAEAVRAKEPYFRDALVRAGHRRSFGYTDDFTRIDETRLARAIVAAGNVICGQGAIAGAQIVSQSPRRRAV